MRTQSTAGPCIQIVHRWIQGCSTSSLRGLGLGCGPWNDIINGPKRKETFTLPERMGFKTGSRWRALLGIGL